MERVKSFVQHLLSFKFSMLASVLAFLAFVSINAPDVSSDRVVLLLLCAELFFFFYLIESFIVQNRFVYLALTAFLAASLYFGLVYLKNDFLSAQVFLVLSSVIIVKSPKPGLDKDIWLWQNSLIKSALEAVVAALLFVGAIFAIAFLVNLLFESANKNLVEMAAKFCLTIVSATVFVWRMNVVRDAQNFFVLSLLNYVLVPLWLIYTILLNLYVLQILFTWTLPKGMVSLPISFSFVFMIICWWGLSFDMQSFWSKRVLRFLVIFHIPLLLLFGLAIGRRIYDYGFTPHRSLLLVYWGFFAEVLYLMIAKKLTAKKLAYSFWLSQILGLLPV